MDHTNSPTVVPAMDKTTKYLIHHMVLPVRLPQKDDCKPAHQQALLNVTIQALNVFKERVNIFSATAQQVASVASAITSLQSSRDEQGHLCEDHLNVLLQQLASNKPGRTVLPLEIKAQNAGMIISNRNNNIVFEIFELEALNSNVLLTSGRLIRTFPTHACAISTHDFLQEGCIQSIAKTLAKMSLQKVPEFQPQMVKGGDSHPEIRNTGHPYLVTDLLVQVFSTIGTSIQVSSMTKRTREDVLWAEGLLPWRRSPLWILIRVTMQLRFNRGELGPKLSHTLYKVSMIYVLTSVLNMASESFAPDEADLIHNLCAKVTRRLRKLNQLQNDIIYLRCSESAREALKLAFTKMESLRKDDIESEDLDIDPDLLSSLQPGDDLSIEIPELNEIFARHSRRKRPKQSKFTPTREFPTYNDNTIPAIFDARQKYICFPHAALERWVELCLHPWTEKHRNDPESCRKLRTLIESYHETAKKMYSEPMSYSIMYLTIMEMYMALDMCACERMPSLLDYSPEMNMKPLEALSLPHRNQLRRLAVVENYFKARQNNAKPDFPSIFRDFGHELSFAVRYYDLHQAEFDKLKSRIEQTAERERDSKRRELERLTMEYRQYMTEADQLACEFKAPDAQGECTPGHSLSCRKCELRNKAASLKIEVHEWPLNTSEDIAKAMVFEAYIPQAFCHWRDANMFLQTNVMGFDYGSKTRIRKLYFLKAQKGFIGVNNVPEYQRIALASSVKPMSRSHIRLKSDMDLITEKDVSVENALDYNYYDTKEATFITDLQPSERIQQSCAYRLPQRSSSLQKFVTAGKVFDGLTQNAAIANPSDCPLQMKLSEYMIFTGVPIGYNLRYMSILSQIAMPTINLATPEAQVLIFHTSLQAGPPPDDHTMERSSQATLLDADFLHELVTRIGILLHKNKANWESWRVFAICIQLLLRAFEYAVETEDIAHLCLETLKNARTYAYEWLKTVQEISKNSNDGAEHAELCSRSTEIALICIQSFDIEGIHPQQVFPTEDHAEIYFRCSIVVQKYQSSTVSDNDCLYNVLIQSWKRVSFRIFVTLSSDGLSCFEIEEGLNEAIRDIWPEFEASEEWAMLDKPNHNWLRTETQSGEVHYDLLTAEVLVDASPLTRLPRRYTDHELYSDLFKTMSAQTVRSNEPGMEYTFKQSDNMMKIHVRFKEGDKDLAVVVLKGGQKFDLVPSRVFDRLLPTAFVNEYYHWYNHERNQIEFTPLTTKWPTGGSPWSLQRIGSGSAWKLVGAHTCLVNPLSNTGLTILSIMERLEDKSHIHIVFDGTTSNVSVELPRAYLDFNFKPGQSNINCKQYGNMIVDHNQQIGTLFGLRKKLVLSHCSNPNDRILLIPEGFVKPQKDPKKRVLRIDVDLTTISDIHTYTIDSTLGRLISSSLQAKLHLCYLHAVTSHCLPDPLTAHTGTENALSILRSAAVFSFNRLTEQNVKTLQLIAALTPIRKFYPLGERVLQQAYWEKALPSMSQHGDFFLAVQNIMTMAQKRSLFCKENSVKPEELTISGYKSMDYHLLRRDLLRTSSFRVDGFGAEHHTSENDQIYHGRQELDPDRTRRSSMASSLIMRESAALHSSIHAGLFVHSLLEKHFAPCEKVEWEETVLDVHEFAFNAKLLEGPSLLFPHQWLNVYFSLTDYGRSYNRFDVMIWLATLAFSASADADVIQALGFFYRNPLKMSAIKLPPTMSFPLSHGERSRDSILKIVQDNRKSLHECPENDIPQKNRETSKNWAKRKEEIFTRNRQNAVESLAEALFAQQAVTLNPTMPTNSDANVYVKAKDTIDSVRDLFVSWRDNSVFYQHIHEVANILERQKVDEVPVTHIFPTVPECPRTDAPSRRSNIEDIFSIEDPSVNLIPLPPPHLNLPCRHDATVKTDVAAQQRLGMLCKALEKQADSDWQRSYVRDLRNSCISLKKLTKNSNEDVVMADASGDILAEEMQELSTEDIILEYASEILKNFSRLNEMLGELVRLHNDFANFTSQLPRISALLWLSQLRKNNYRNLSDSWKKIIIHFGLTVTEMNRANRLVTMIRDRQSHEALGEELSNIGHENWDPSEFPEILLFEAESGIIVRKSQHNVANKMRYPPSGRNAVMQLSMGEGKSTVVLPIVITTLADGNMLVRVVVGKAQFTQMRQVLISRLGGLLNRPIFEMPFSRSLKLTGSEADTIYDLCDECRRIGGIILMQPEHILSFKMMSLESILSGKTKIGNSLFKIQKSIFEDLSRDVVDECDEAFNPNTDVAFTMGLQRIVEMGPDRWNLVQSVMSLMVDCISQVKVTLPSSLQVDYHGERRFPRTRIQREDAAEKLMDLIADGICTKGLPGLPIDRQSEPIRQGIYTYIRNLELSMEEIDLVEKSEFWTNQTISALYIIRGLIAGGILVFTLRSKRWRVNYGIDAARSPKTKLAVPYRAKDNPSARSEFNHPEVITILSSLHYYYEGLSDEELFHVFDHLLKSDDANIEYAKWTERVVGVLPRACQSLTGINLKNRHRCTTIFPIFRFEKPVIDYYLSNIVFSKELREFPKKLSASGWDLGANKHYPTTGFSGTTDSKYVLPLNMEYLELEDHSHTNAMILTRILHCDNTVQLVPHRDADKHTSDAEHLLCFVNNIEKATRVIIDVGAQILELENCQVAKAWMNINKEAKGVVYFHDEELVVRDRQGRIELLHTSPFAKELGDCLVYLDESHTRGTDLKLPHSYQAAVLLGVNLTKDKLTQACLRMRKLAQGQSVVLCINDEIKMRILDQNEGKDATGIDIPDVLQWTINETWTDTRRSMPMWATQGCRFEKQDELWRRIRYPLTEQQADLFQEDDLTTIKERYSPRTERSSITSLENSSSRFAKRIFQRCRDLQAFSMGTVTFDEERERELNPEVEIEEEREVERRPKADHVTPHLSDEIVQVVETSKIPERPSELIPAFQALQHTSIAKYYDLRKLPASLLVTKDFSDTVKIPIGKNAPECDSYLKPVQWLLSIHGEPHRRLIVISAYEADQLLPRLRQSKTAKLHLYAPRTSLAYDSIDLLNLYQVGMGKFLPRTIDVSDTIQLNLFAGQVYHNSHQDYSLLCRYIGLASTPEKKRRAQADGFIKGQWVNNKWGLEESPVEFFFQLMKMRRQGEGLRNTHMGKMLRGTVLTADDFV